MKNNIPLPSNEKERLEALRQYDVMDTAPEEEFDNITKLASYICQAPICLISLLDENRHWFKSSIGLDVKEIPRDISFCQHAIMGDDIFEVPDTLENETFANNPFVTGSPNIRFYAGTPLKNQDGYNIGTLCVIDRVPRKLSSEQKEALETLGRQVIAQLELKRKNKELKSEIEKLAEAQYDKKVNEEKYQVFFENSQALMCTHDLNGKFLTLNEASANNLGYSKEELIGKTIYDIVLKEWYNAVDEYLKNLTENSYYSGLMKVICKNGDIKTWYYKNTRLNIDAENSYIIGNAIDVTDRVALEQKMKKAKELAEMAVYAKDSFLANMSHEIRTPMNAIIGFTDLLFQSNLDAKQLDYVQDVKIAGDNLLSIINDILDLSKIESGKLNIDAFPFSIKETLKNVQELLKIKSKEKKIEFDLFLDARIPDYVIGDSGRLNQIMVNLAGNAIKFTNEGNVTIAVQMVDETINGYEIFFSVKDTGIGIPREKLALIFERFTQANGDTTRKFGGTGLGLNIAKSLIELQGGEINVESTEGRGSEFSFRITYNKITVPVVKAVTNASQYKKPEKQVKVLLCEDNALNQRLASNVMELFGFELEIANNGAEGIALLKKNTYDVILMDLQMPEMDGYQATIFIRDELKLNTPIIAMTAHSLAGEKEKCIEVGMNEYVPKPFKQDDLYNKIMVLTQQKPPEKVVLNEYITKSYPGVLSLDYLKELSHGNKTFEKEMIELFIDQMPVDINTLKKAMDEKDYPAVKGTAHKIKSSLSLLELEDLKDDLKNFEKEAEQKIISEQTKLKFEELNKRLDTCYEVLHTILSEEYK